MSLDSTEKSVLPAVPHRGSRIKLWVFVFAIGTVLVVLAPWLLVEAVWDGHFALTLDVVSESGMKIKALSYTTFFNREQADWATKNTGGEADLCLHSAVQDNRRFVADIGCSGRLWIFNIETKYTEPRYIVFRVKYGDGKELRCWAEMPVGRGPRSLAVMVP